MRSAYLLPVLLVLLAALTACSGGAAEPAPEEYAPELVVEAPEALPPPAEPQPEELAVEPMLEEPVQEQPPPPEEVVAEEPLPAHLQYIVDAGQFSGEFDDGFAAYENTLLGFVYRFGDEDRGSFWGVVAPEEPSTLMLMIARGFGESLVLSVITGSGEEWVEEHARDYLEELAQGHKAWHEEARRGIYVSDYESWITNRFATRAMNEDYRAEWDEVVDPITLEEVDAMSFWPVEYVIADRHFSGLQINVITPGFGLGALFGYTYLFHQIDDDTALVISIISYSRFADETARRHITRFTALP